MPRLCTSPLINRARWLAPHLRARASPGRIYIPPVRTSALSLKIQTTPFARSPCTHLIFSSSHIRHTLCRAALSSVAFTLLNNGQRTRSHPSNPRTNPAYHGPPLSFPRRPGGRIYHHRARGPWPAHEAHRADHLRLHEKMGGGLCAYHLRPRSRSIVLTPKCHRRTPPAAPSNATVSP